MTFFEFIVLRHEQILRLLVEHTRILLFALFFAVIIGVPIGILVSSVRRVSSPIMLIINGLQAVPSLALLGFLIPLVGVTEQTAIILIVIYAVLPIVKNTYAGILNIGPQYIEAARGMGMTRLQMLRHVQFPLALPVIMTGVRIASVAGVGLVTIAAFAGGRGLGHLVFSGIATLNTNMILAGAIPAALLALLMDFIVSRIEKAVTA
ncbi:MAG: ABC transporter permease [Oscillospiraceae bacterium]|nr:ABC transporter permease [Oscillospiraceae bacterium]